MSIKAVVLDLAKLLLSRVALLHVAAYTRMLRKRQQSPAPDPAVTAAHSHVQHQAASF
jgi:hypothetical protein